MPLNSTATLTTASSRVGRFVFSWLNKVSHYEDGVTSI